MIADFLLEKNVIPQSELEIYIYGYETIISSFVDLLIALTVGLISKQIVMILIFFAMFVSVRLYTGGYHAKTFTGCKTVFITICLLVSLLSELPLPPVLCILILLLFIITGCFLAPIENHNKPLTDEEQMKYHKISIVISVFWSVAALLLYFFAIKICLAITLTAAVITILMAIGEYERREKNEGK